MSYKHIPFILFILLMGAFCSLIAVTPYLAGKGSPLAPFLYNSFGLLCHQITSRSLCLFHADGYYVSSCVPDEEFSYSKETEVVVDGVRGYKFPVCSRDISIYFSMLIGGLLFPFFWRIEKTEWPSKWILLGASVPIAIDGGMQLLGIWESSNLARVATGAVIGVVLPFYIIPMLNMLAKAIMETVKREKR